MYFLLLARIWKTANQVSDCRLKAKETSNLNGLLVVVECFSVLFNGGHDDATERERSYNRTAVMRYAGTRRYIHMNVIDSVWDSNALVD